MGKIKKIYKYTFIILFLFIVLPSIAFFLLKVPSVQTYLGGKFMNRISERIQGDIEFSHLHYSYFNRVTVSDLLIRDFSYDTLIYSPRVQAGIRKIKKKERLLRLGRIKVEAPIIKIKPDSAGDLNILYYLDFIIPEDTAKRNRELSINQIRINNGALSYTNGKPSTQGPGLIDINNINMEELDITIDKLEKLWKNVALSLSELSFKTDKGFELINMFTQVDIGSDHFHFIDPTIRTRNSFINSDILGIDFNPGSDNFSFVRDGNLRLRINSSLVGLADLGYFINELKGFKEEITFSGDLRGTIAELKGRKLDLSLDDTTRLVLDFDMSGLPEIENTFMFIDIEEFKTHTSKIEQINIPGKGYIDLGDKARRMGDISFIGNFTGFLTDFVTYGKFRSDIGNISTDIKFKPDKKNSFVYTGSFDIEGADIGQLTGSEDLLGKASASFEIDGYSESFNKFRANLKGSIDSLDLNNYIYRDIKVDGLFTESSFDGSVNSYSDKLDLNLLGRYDFSDTIPELDFSLNLLNADLYALNIDPGDSTSNLSMLLTANIVGNNINNMTGEVRMLNSRIRKFGEELDLYDVGLKASEERDVYRLELNTDIIDAELYGDYNISTIGNGIKNIAYRLAPSLAGEDTTGIKKLQEKFTYTIDFKNSDRVNEFFRTGLQIAPGTNIQGELLADNSFSLNASGDYIVYNNNSLIDYSINLEAKDSISELIINSYKANLVNRIDIDSLDFNISTMPDNIDLKIAWNNEGSINKGGNLAMHGELMNVRNGKLAFVGSVLPTTIDIRDNKWNISSSVFEIDSSAISVDNLLVNHNNDYFRINGKISEDMFDTLYMDFNNLDLSVLNHVKKQDAATKEDKIDFQVAGNIGGSILLTDFYNNPMFESNLTIGSFKTNEHEHGDVTLISQWDNMSKVADILIFNSINGAQTFGINGYYDPVNSDINLLTEVTNMPLDILNLVLFSFASGVKGYGTGSVIISGNPSGPYINGKIMAADASMVIDYLQTRFRFSDSIILKDQSYVFDSIEIRDDRGNLAMLNGAVSHNAFKDFDIDIKIDAQNMRVLDTRQKDNDIFYGTAFASGTINIDGDKQGLGLNISARTERNTRIFIPLNSSEEVSDYSFISFTEQLLDSTQKRQISLPIRMPEEDSRMGLDFNLDVTQDAEIQLVFDASVGDVMRSRGTGNLNLSLDKDGSFTMYGNYTIEDGDYLLTLGNIFSKRFEVENGGSIVWNGELANSTVDIKAIYKLKASLFELLQDPNYMERIPVECHLNMTGQLIDPVIGFDIYLPTADEQTRTNLRNAINSDEEMSRQFLYLLVMNSFYPDPSYANTTSTTTTGASAMGVTTTEMLSNQLSNWLSQISNDFDIGFTYRPGNEISTQEVEVALSTQLLNDRVTINGNFDVAGQETSSSTKDISGDFDVEVKLTEKVRLKVFNRSNDNILYETAPYTQGFGFFFRQEFNRFRDIFIRKNKDIRKEEEIKIADN